MSSSEEYLDSLLKALTEGEDSADKASASDDVSETRSADRTDGMQSNGADALSTDEEHNKAMSMNEIEAMFASMGETSAEEEGEPDGLASDGILLAEETDSDEGMTPDDFMLEGEQLPETEGISDGLVPGEMEPDTGEAALLDDFALDENMMPEEMAPDVGTLSDDFALDESLMPEEMEAETDGGTLLDDYALDENMMPEEMEAETDGGTLLDDFALDESLMPEEMEAETDGGTLLDDFALDESLMPEEMEAETDGGTLLDDFALDESLMPEEMEAETDGGILLDDFALDESLMPEEMETEESSGSDDLSLDDLNLDDLGLDDLGLDDSVQMGEAAGSDDISVDDFALEESGEDDDDLSALLAGMGSDDDLAEINDLLEKADKGMSDDDDMLAMLGGVSGSGEDGESDDDYNFFGEDRLGEETGEIREITSGELEERENSKKAKKERKKIEKEKKKKEKQEKKRKKKEGAPEGEGEDNQDAALDDLLGSMDMTEEKPKKQGFFGRLMTALLEEEEDDELAGEGDAGAELANLSDENKELLAELKAEDKKNAKKKEKKGKKGKKKDGEAGAEGEGAEESEAKSKKPKREKKKKKEKNVEDELKEPEKKLSKKKVTSVFLFCATLAACIIVLSMLLPTQFEKQEARVAYDYGQYEQVYDLLYGKKLSEEDESLLQKSSIILQTRRKLESYENYTRMDMPIEALNALLEGVSRYHNLEDEAERYHISDELYDVYDQILAALSDGYGVSEAEALDIISAGDDVTYSQKVEAVVYGESFDDAEDLPEVKQDVLPEEEEIIDRLQSTEDVEEPQQTEENTDVMQAEEELLEE